ncbi:MAG: hypothetical protein ACD_48C00177G0002 [uncultured bacterium]|nr:MAG: hypothetical protein ACD_48C00177G0002 [uncultured bacterium]
MGNLTWNIKREYKNKKIKANGKKDMSCGIAENPKFSEKIKEIPKIANPYFIEEVIQNRNSK